MSLGLISEIKKIKHLHLERRWGGVPDVRVSVLYHGSCVFNVSYTGRKFVFGPQQVGLIKLQMAGAWSKKIKVAWPFQRALNQAAAQNRWIDLHVPNLHQFALHCLACSYSKTRFFSLKYVLSFCWVPGSLLSSLGPHNSPFYGHQ